MADAQFAVFEHEHDMALRKRLAVEMVRRQALSPNARVLNLDDPALRFRQMGPAHAEGLRHSSKACQDRNNDPLGPYRETEWARTRRTFPAVPQASRTADLLHHKSKTLGKVELLP